MRRSTLVDLDDAGFDIVADLEDVLHALHVLFAELRDVHEAIDVVLEADEGTEARDLRDRALDQIAHLEAGVDVGPWIVLELLDAQADALVRLVDVDDDGFDFLALLEDLARDG